MSDGASKDDDEYQGASTTTNPAITYTRTRKTKTAASATRRRNNIPLCHSTGGGGTADAASGSHDKSWFSRKASGWTDDDIRSHLVSGGASKGGASLSMEGDLIQGGSSNTSRKKKKRLSGPRFAWEEEEEEEEEKGIHMKGKDKSIMRAAPTLQDIMDEQDQIDLLAPQKLGQDYQSLGAGDMTGGDYIRPNRRSNAALAEIAQCFDKNDANIGAVVPTAVTDSIGWRLLRILGYRSRLGMAFVSLPGHSGGKDDSQANDFEMHVTNNLSAKHLASKGLRAIRLPSIAQSKNTDEMRKPTDVQVLDIPPPKINKHGIGYDPFKNAPEFRAFHEKRKALAKKRGRAADNDGFRSTAYYTDDLRRDERQRLWDKSDRDKDESNMESNKRSSSQQDGQHLNYAAQDYTDFIGTKASSGFALEDEDDANVYHEDDRDGDDRSGYNLEVHSPLASDNDEDDNHNGLFRQSATSDKRNADVKKSVGDAWDAWGMGEGESVKAVTADGKPPLEGFQLGQQVNDNTKRWTGPMVPSGYVLQRHVFPANNGAKATTAYTVNSRDCGLGLDLQYHRTSQRQSQSSVPTILPHPMQQRQSQMRARNGTELNFNAVKESMKNRFVFSSGNDSTVSPKTDRDEETLQQEEFVHVTRTNWQPSRLLCKRWGIPQPSLSANAISERVSTGEEACFNETVLPNQKVGDGRRGSLMVINGGRVDDDNLVKEAVGEDNFGPPPVRPPDDVFKTIFDEGSDMEISSSEDEVEESISSKVLAEKPELVAEYSDSSSSEREGSRHQSHKSRYRREDRRRWKKSHRRRSPSKSSDDSDETDIVDDYDKRRRKKKKRHKRSHSRHKEKRRR